MKTLTASILAAAFSGTSLAALPVAAATLHYDRLPLGKVSTVPAPKRSPAKIAAARRVDGFWLAAPPKSHRAGMRRGMKSSSLFSSRAEARAFTKKGFFGGERKPGVCFAIMPMNNQPIAGDEWPAQFMQVGSIWHDNHSRSRITAVHAERFVPGADGHGTLVMTDAWADAVSLGVKLIARTKLQLVRVAKGPEGIEVYAAREQGKVHFVVRGPKLADVDADARRFVQGFTGRLQVETGETNGFSDCGHIRATLHTGPGGGEAATVRAEVPLTDSIETSQAPSMGGQNKAPGRRFREIQVRPANVFLSVSQTSVDKKPIASVSFGWDGEGRTFQF